MTDSMRHVRLSTGHTLEVWDARTMAHTGQYQLRYEFRAADESLLFEGADYGVSPMDSIDSDAALLGLLDFLTLRPGDTDSEYFAEYTPAQMDWAQSSACESLSCDISVAEEAGGCACVLWENLDHWGCDEDERGNVADFEVLDHGEDGSQYFQGCGTAYSKFDEVSTGVGDTASEALEEALESMARNDPAARMSKLQEHWARACLPYPDRSAHESVHTPEELADEEYDHDGCDWNHYVSIRYNLRKDS